MDEQIKDRIAKINRGEVPEGYKKTKFGIFPCDWETDKTLKDIGVFGKGKGLPGNKMCDSGVPCVGYGDIYMKYNNFHFEKAQNFVDEETARDSLPIGKGTLLFTATGETAEEIGKCVCYNGEETIYAGGDIITYNSEINPLFIAYQQYQPFALAQKASFGQGHSVVHIRQNSLQKLNVAYPKSEKEQERIAEILLKWDGAIEWYERQIKTIVGFKSICLTKMFPQKSANIPEWRFNGFSDLWENHTVEDVFEKITDYVAAGSFADLAERVKYLSEPDYAQLIRTIDIKNKFENGDFVYISRDAFEYLWRVELTSSENIVLPNIGANIGEVYLVSPDDLPSKKCVLGPNAILLGSSNNMRFLYSYLQTKNFQENLKLIIAASGQPKFNKSELRKIRILIPSKEEQEKIGAMIGYVDKIIETYGCRLRKLKMQYNILQSYLLNGIVRV